MKTNAWSNLPNAKQIDAVLASLKSDPKKWADAWTKAGGRTEEQSAARDASWHASLSIVGGSGPVLTRMCEAILGESKTWDSVHTASWHAILALVAYDDCAHLLTTKPEHVKMLAGIGNEAATLLYPASLVFSEFDK